MKFDIFGIILMIIAIALGNLGGSMLAGFIGFGGGIIGALIIGAVIYVIWTWISGGKMTFYDGAIFSVLVYIAQIIAGMIGGFTGTMGGILTLVFEALALSILWGYIGGKQASKAPVSLKGRR